MVHTPPFPALKDAIEAIIPSGKTSLGNASNESDPDDPIIVTDDWYHGLVLKSKIAYLRNNNEQVQTVSNVEMFKDLACVYRNEKHLTKDMDTRNKIGLDVMLSKDKKDSDKSKARRKEFIAQTKKKFLQRMAAFLKGTVVEADPKTYTLWFSEIKSLYGIGPETAASSDSLTSPRTLRSSTTQESGGGRSGIDSVISGGGPSGSRDVGGGRTLRSSTTQESGGGRSGIDNAISGGGPSGGRGLGGSSLGRRRGCGSSGSKGSGSKSGKKRKQATTNDSRKRNKADDEEGAGLAEAILEHRTPSGLQTAKPSYEQLEYNLIWKGRPHNPNEWLLYKDLVSENEIPDCLVDYLHNKGLRRRRPLGDICKISDHVGGPDDGMKFKVHYYNENSRKFDMWPLALFPKGYDPLCKYLEDQVQFVSGSRNSILSDSFRFQVTLVNRVTQWWPTWFFPSDNKALFTYFDSCEVDVEDITRFPNAQSSGSETTLDIVLKNRTSLTVNIEELFRSKSRYFVYLKQKGFHDRVYKSFHRKGLDKIIPQEFLRQYRAAPASVKKKTLTNIDDNDIVNKLGLLKGALGQSLHSIMREQSISETALDQILEQLVPHLKKMTAEVTEAKLMQCSSGPSIVIDLTADDVPDDDDDHEVVQEADEYNGDMTDWRKNQNTEVDVYDDINDGITFEYDDQEGKGDSSSSGCHSPRHAKASMSSNPESHSSSSESQSASSNTVVQASSSQASSVESHWKDHMEIYSTLNDEFNSKVSSAIYCPNHLLPSGLPNPTHHYCVLNAVVQAVFWASKDLFSSLTSARVYNGDDEYRELYDALIDLFAEIQTHRDYVVFESASDVYWNPIQEAGQSVKYKVRFLRDYDEGKTVSSSDETYIRCLINWYKEMKPARDFNNDTSVGRIYAVEYRHLLLMIAKLSKKVLGRTDSSHFSEGPGFLTPDLFENYLKEFWKHAAESAYGRLVMNFPDILTYDHKQIYDFIVDALVSSQAVPIRGTDKLPIFSLHQQKVTELPYSRSASDLVTRFFGHPVHTITRVECDCPKVPTKGNLCYPNISIGVKENQAPVIVQDLINTWLTDTIVSTRCPVCHRKQKTITTTRLIVERLPNVFVIATRSESCAEDGVEIDLEHSLNLSIENVSYTLASYVDFVANERYRNGDPDMKQHTGKHYVTMCYDSKTNLCIRFDDKLVTSSNSPNTTSGTVLMFYKKSS
jgi:hypothetical protein